MNHEQTLESAIRQLMEELHETYQKPADAPYRTPEIRSIVLRIMTLLCRDHSTSEKQAERPERSISYVKQAIDYIRAACDKDISLEDVASFVGISKYYLSREFHRYTGYPFVAYVNRTRCKKAQQMLDSARLSSEFVFEQLEKAILCSHFLVLFPQRNSPLSRTGKGRMEISRTNRRWK